MEFLQPVRYIPGSSEAEFCGPQTFEDSKSGRQGRAVMAYSKVYGVAKMISEILKAFGSELDDTPTDIKFHISRVEKELTQPYSAKLLAAVEDLFYILLARVKSEIRQIDIEESFEFDYRFSRTNSRLLRSKGLPEIKHLRLIFEACKCLLLSEEVCSVLNTELIRHQEEDYIQQTMLMGEEAGYFADDPVGYRQYIQSLITDPDSPYRMKWSGLNAVYDASPEMIFATLREKYMGITARERKRGKCAGVKVKSPPPAWTSNPAYAEERRIQANREAACAMLHGITVGEFRRRNSQVVVRQYVQQNLCVCLENCTCSRRCTVKGWRICPCTSRMNLLYEEDLGLRRPFVERCADMAVILFEELSASYQGIGLHGMTCFLNRGLEFFHDEITHFRDHYWQAVAQDNYYFDFNMDFQYRQRISDGVLRRQG
ncbi:hypothetical protein H112_02187 [Trichophyton rubrum D6]|uniref:Uncharacterized protein n=4 Tax=Trichophyton TaxID=5550 RepID=A0A178EYT7_TRIRU|nr:uncharacterized protein TERG_06947 [Trichophyton rubrum CBS 118892]EZF55184.1 hypothetical protein H103_02191 [Trichophyton rubrum CBS 288.86]EZF76442.1 hypothetical protein H105_02203 [Trichophyton soudanense CBS 452.61]EZF87117.1 hypothetical protein H110_02187 [Trichophyton rubrum MR1448]EZG08869.1 hypothetical protein H106_02052 [Trichophyton rubrum CBS 735.88]EZG19439.1 hypothetical protein H107_02256 [Trichophyton rubrum CBS 202.88]KDB36302.1 hypothetical protein H112_02187 [Trichoph